MECESIRVDNSLIYIENCIESIDVLKSIHEIMLSYY